MKKSSETADFNPDSRVPSPNDKKQRDVRFPDSHLRSPNEKKQRDGRFHSRLARTLAQWKKAARQQISIQTRAFARPMKKKAARRQISIQTRACACPIKKKAARLFQSGLLRHVRTDGWTDATNYNTPGPRPKWPRGNKNWEEMET